MTKKVLLSIVVVALAQESSWADEVAYSIVADNFAAQPVERVSVTPEPQKMRIAERVWATPGIEQSRYPLPPPPHITDGRYCVSYFDMPSWLAGSVWPRTREILRTVPEPVIRSLLATRSAESEQMVFNFGGGAVIR